MEREHRVQVQQINYVGIILVVHYHHHLVANTIEFITIATLGNATDFGDLSGINNESGSAFIEFNSRCDWWWINSIKNKLIDFVTIASTGNASDFGDLHNSVRRIWCGACSDVHGGLGD